MNFKDLVVMVLSNLERMRTRTVLTSLGVVIGTLAVVLLVSLGVGLQRLALKDISKQFGTANIITVFPGQMMAGQGAVPQPVTTKQAKLDNLAVKKFKSIVGVEAVVPIKEIPVSEVKFRRFQGPPASLVGISKDDISSLGLKVTKGTSSLAGKKLVLGNQIRKQFFNPKNGKPLSSLELLGKQIKVFVSKSGASGPPPGPMSAKEPPSQESDKGYRLNLLVVGYLKAGNYEDDNRLYISTKLAQRLSRFLPKEFRTQYNFIKVKVSSASEVATVQQKIQKLGFSAFSLVDVLKGVNTFFLVVQAVLAGLASIALLVAAFGIANTMTMAIYERTKELGIMKAVGASNKDIRRIFLLEAATIGFFGGFIGVILGYLLGKLINLGLFVYLSSQKASGFQGAVIFTPWWLVLFALLFATVVGLVSGVLPAARAATLSPLGALRHE